MSATLALFQRPASTPLPSGSGRTRLPAWSKRQIGGVNHVWRTPVSQSSCMSVRGARPGRFPTGLSVPDLFVVPFGLHCILPRSRRSKQDGQDDKVGLGGAAPSALAPPVPLLPGFSVALRLVVGT